jgi:6-phosphogluconolactonase
MMNWVIRPSAQELGEEFCQRLLALLAERRHAPAARDLLSGDETPQSHLSMALTGGSSAKAFYTALAAHQQEWAPDAIDFFWSDERMVPADNPDSNYRLAYESLLGPCAVPIDRIHRVPTELAPDACASAYLSEIRRYVPENQDGIPGFPVLILGLGADGHTASLFPHTDIFGGDDRLVRPAGATPDHPHPRMTFTPKLINAAQQVWFVITGEKKAEAVEHLYRRSGSVRETPALLVDPEKTAITFFVDEGAARLIREMAAD